MKHLLCSLLLLVAAFQALAVSPEKDWKETKTEFATFMLPEKWDSPAANVHFGMPEFFNVNTDDGKKYKIFNKGALYSLNGTEAFSNELIVSRHRAENGYKATISDIKGDFDNQVSYRSSGKAHIIWMSVTKDLTKGIATVVEKEGIHGKWVDILKKYVIYVRKIGSDVYAVHCIYTKDKAKLTDDEYNQHAKSVIESLKPVK